MKKQQIVIPEWFDPQMIPILEKKVDRSGMKKRERTLDWLIRQQLKIAPTTLTKMVTKKFTWEDVEEIIEENCQVVRESLFRPDAVIGIKSGGALIANYVAKCLNVEHVDYMYISHYSANSRSIVKSTITCMGKAAVIKEEPIIELAGKKILLVDDQSASGATLEAGKEYFAQKGAVDCKTFCLYTRKKDADFCERIGTMVYTPWGKDA